MLARQALRLWPRFLQPLVHWFLPSCRRLRALMRELRNIVQPLVDKKRTGDISGRTSDNLVAWMDEISRGRPFDAALSQMASSFAAIHTTSDFFTQLLIDLCNDPGLIDSLRKEVIMIITGEGWKRSSLQNLKLMDSVLKESQRLKPSGTSEFFKYSLIVISSLLCFCFVVLESFYRLFSSRPREHPSFNTCYSVDET
jgi:cytochrome P450